LEQSHASKVQEMRVEVMDLKKGFENRCAEFKKQIQDFKSNNEAVDALKKAHA